MKPEFAIVCQCGNKITKEVEHRSTSTLTCVNCESTFEVYTYFRELPQPPCACDDLVKLGVAEAMRPCSARCKTCQHTKSG